MPPKKKPSPSTTDRVRAFFGRREVRIAFFSVLAAVAVSSLAVAGRYIRLSLRQAALNSTSLDVTFTRPPEWLHGRDRNEMEAIEKTHVPRPMTAQEVAETFTSPWIRSARVRRQAGGYDVELDFRRPVQAIVWGKSCCYADRDGVPLDIHQVDATVGAACITVEGLETRGIPRLGEPLDDPKTRLVGSLAENLQRLRPWMDIEAMRLTSGGRGADTLELRTRGGARILWGPLTAEFSEKVAMLERRAVTSPPLAPDAVWDLSKPNAPTAADRHG